MSLLERYGEQLQVAGVETQYSKIVNIVTTMDKYQRCESCTEDELYKCFKVCILMVFIATLNQSCYLASTWKYYNHRIKAKKLDCFFGF